jgi:hypothetical protein
MVWKGTKEVGFGIAGDIVVAFYYPPGNQSGQWEQNVQKP